MAGGNKKHVYYEKEETWTLCQGFPEGLGDQQVGRAFFAGPGWVKERPGQPG